ncbi:MAG: hypothetical protein ACRC1M_05960 [Methanobacteriaceae archaeon]
MASIYTIIPISYIISIYTIINIIIYKISESNIKIQINNNDNCSNKSNNNNSNSNSDSDSNNDNDSDSGDNDYNLWKNDNKRIKILNAYRNILKIRIRN